MPQASLGRTVIVKLQQHSNGQDIAPAVITRVWGPSMINVTAFPDLSPPVSLSSLQLYDSYEEAKLSGSSFCGWWPDRTA
jgi:hypothetical protein